VPISQEVLSRLDLGLSYCYSIPFIDDVEDFVWESVWSYGVGLPNPDPLNRSKKLFDVTDPRNGVGWSAKTLVWSFERSRECEFVIQRADVFKKASQLGFSHLSVDSDPEVIGAAVMEHWRRKVVDDQQAQGVTDPRLVVLLKQIKSSGDQISLRWAVIEEELEIPEPEEILWTWTNEQKLGLQGKRKSDGFVKFRWYSNQKQLFERLQFPVNMAVTETNVSRLDVQDILG